jgi:hypothetical protein
MPEKNNKFYEKPMVQKIAGLTLIAGIATVYAIFSAFHNNNKDG